MQYLLVDQIDKPRNEREYAKPNGGVSNNMDDARVFNTEADALAFGETHYCFRDFVPIPYSET
jgi:hypothetical protein